MDLEYQSWGLERRVSGTRTFDAAALHLLLVELVPKGPTYLHSRKWGFRSKVGIVIMVWVSIPHIGTKVYKHILRRVESATGKP